MRKIYLTLFTFLIVATGVGIHYWNSDDVTYTKPPKRTRIDEAIKWRNEITQDPALGYVPHDRMMAVYRRIEELKATAHLRTGSLSTARWRDRGPYDVGGRTRAILIDKNDPTGKTVFTAGVTGGLWKTTNIEATTVQWQPIGHNYDNINISSIAQDPNNPNIMYYGTGEPHGGAGRGLGIWKSINGGLDWGQIASTINPNFFYVVRLFVHPVTSDVYAATESGLLKSTDGGTSWTKVLGQGVTPGVSNAITDLEYAADGAIYISDGHNGGSSNIYRSDAGANQGDVGTWQRLTISGSGFPGGRTRVELACAPSDAGIIYALAAVGGDASGIYRSVNRGANWTKTSDAPGALGMNVFTRGQAWYDLTIDVNPTNENNLIIGGIDLLSSSNGGTTWTQISQWFGGGGFQYVHADQHLIMWDDARPNRVLFGNDGGIAISTNGGQTIKHKNTGYNVTQFYGMAMHPDQFSNYFLAGAQDNGTQQFNSFEQAVTNEVLGGDGFTCHIDQDDGMVQIISLYFGDFRISTDGGETFGTLRSGALGSGFYTPSDWDSDADIFYCQTNGNGQFHRWKLSDGPGNDGQNVNISGFSSPVRSVYVSDNVANRIYIGSSAGRIMKIDNAHVGTSVSGTAINLPSGGNISSIVEAAGDANHLIATISNYGVNSVWQSTNGGTNWTSIEGDLPDMPVNWAVFHPYDNDKVLLGTDAGVWVTEDVNGGATNWVVSGNMPIVRTDMLQTRTSDGLIAAGTYGRGIFSTDFLSPSVPRMDLKRVAYLNASPGFNDFSINAQTWLWNFGDGNSSTDEEPAYTYNTVGTYNVTLTINDTASTSDIVKILPDRPTPYTTEAQVYGGGFESNDQDFGVDTRSGTAWEKGNSNVPLKNGTVSGNNAWVTGLTNNFYANNTETYLYTPNFDLTDEAIYELKFYAKYNISQGFDGMQVQYSTNRGQTWSVLGTYNDDLDEDLNKWYNYTSSSNQTAFPNGTSYFTGFQPDWKEFKVPLNNLVGQPDVAFRFAFRSNGTNRQAGIAIDDFRITKYDDILETVLREFTAGFTTPNGSEISLDWTTQPEYRCKHFKIQVSENGKDFTEYIVEIPAQGSTADLTSYNYSPLNMIKGLYYFKIKVVDFDDNFFFSDTRVVSRNDDEAPLDLGKVYPNPFGDYLDLAFTKFVDENLVINLYDATGRLVISEGVVPNDVYIRIPTAQLQAGVYILEILSNGGDDRITRKLIKH